MFSSKILPVYELKTNIKKEHPKTFADIDSQDLILWKVEIPFDNEAKLEVLNNAYVNRCDFDIEKGLGGQKLEATTKCQQLAGNIHIIVEKPLGNNNIDNIKLRLVSLLSNDIEKFVFDKIVQDFEDLSVSEREFNIYHPKVLTLKFAREMGCLRKGYQVEYHGNTVETSTYDGEHLITKDGTKCKSFIEFIKKADPSVVSSNPEHQEKLKFNGVAYKDFRARVFFIQKVLQITGEVLSRTLMN
ncbi:16199_t:CDS:2 [Funneliformis caledonium]|uniref:16199_t:CDS:1 n=1 Tax=Funneliformis caledonium TaxID=1117310 RepID=A0A9N9GF28_9GLOM|nr:16199_t:CDS:2 [Funneliformis caledonium]